MGTQANMDTFGVCVCSAKNWHQQNMRDPKSLLKATFHASQTGCWQTKTVKELVKVTARWLLIISERPLWLWEALRKGKKANGPHFQVQQRIFGWPGKTMKQILLKAANHPWNHVLTCEGQEADWEYRQHGFTKENDAWPTWQHFMKRWLAQWCGNSSWCCLSWLQQSF